MQCDEQIKAGDLVTPRLNSVLAYNETMDKDIFLPQGLLYYCIEVVNSDALKLLMDKQILYVVNVEQSQGKVIIKIA